MRSLAFAIFAATTLTGGHAIAGSSLFAPYSQGLPDILSNSGKVVYDATNNTLDIDAFAQQYTSDGVSFEDITNGDFFLDASIDENADLTGQTITGTLEINGTTTTFGSGTLLSGDLFAFRSGGGEQMEFLFNIKSSLAADAFGGVGAVGLIILDQTGFNGSFLNNFNNAGDFAAVADTAGTNPVVPEPGSFLLATLGLIGVAGGNRFRRKRRPESE